MEHQRLSSFASAETVQPFNELWVTLDRLRAEFDNLLTPSRELRQDPIKPMAVRSIINARKRRAKLFDPELFSDPAWDMLLELYAVHLEQQKVSTSGLCYIAEVPLTTTLRWLDKLHKLELTIRVEDPLDGRRFWIELTPKGVAAMEQYFRETREKVHL